MKFRPIAALAIIAFCCAPAHAQEQSFAAFEAARQVLRFAEAWARVERLDGKAPAAGQTHGGHW